MTRFSQIDLSALPAPDIVETLDYETILKEMRDDLVARFPAIEGVIDLESEPARKLLEVAAYREILVRARINDAARSLLLASASGADLDNLGALFATARQAGETDARYRRRIQLAPEAFSVAGPQGAYVYHALTALPEARDATAIRAAPGHVTVTVLKEGDDETPTEAERSAVAAALNTEDVRPLTDVVSVIAPTVVPVEITAELVLYPGPDADLVRQRASDALNAWLAANRMLNANLTLSAIYSALHQNGVMTVNLTSPAADVEIAPTEVFAVTALTLTVADVRDE